MPYDSKIRMQNEAFVNAILSGNVKVAQEAGDNFLKRRVREDGVVREILPPHRVNKEDFVPQVNTDQPVIIVEMEPGSPGAMSMPFGDYNPPTFYMQGKRFMVVLDRISSSWARKDEAELATYRADIKQLLAEMLVKDLSWQEDARFISAVNTLLGGAAGGTNVLSGLVQWREISGGVSRTNIGEAFKIAFEPPSRIPVTRILCNGAMQAELFKWDRLEVGGDDAQAILYEGWGKRSLNGAELIVTIKRELVPDDTMYFFGHPDFIGKTYVWMEPSLYITKEDTEVRFRAHEILGSAIGHGDGVFRFDFVTESEASS